MMQANNIVKIEGGKVRLSDSELHRLACKAIWESNHIVFESTPNLISQIIENETWRSFQHEDFASYALDATSNGLGINTNQRLWILRCSMDVHGKHISQWAEVLAKVEQVVKLYAAEEGKTIRSFNGNSLEKLAKGGVSPDTRITYLPSRQTSGDGGDGHLVRLRKNRPGLFKKIVAGDMTMIEARREAGLIEPRQTNLGRGQSAVRKMTAKERREFIAWLKDEGHL